MLESWNELEVAWQILLVVVYWAQHFASALFSQNALTQNFKNWLKFPLGFAILKPLAKNLLLFSNST